MAAVPLLCPVRGCGEPLARGERGLACPRGHAFDRARSGYVNLLQPQDRRSREPGDSRQAALARRRLVAAGRLDPLLATLVSTAAGLQLAEPPAVLDLGCGEGSVLAAVVRSLARSLQPSLAGPPGAEAHGVDISTPAIDLAARAYPEATWIVANADRPLPYPDGAFDLALSITARQPARELRRVLRKAGRLIVAVPAPDDLQELREAIGGERLALAGWERTAAAFAPDFALAAQATMRWTTVLDAAGIDDVLATSYRGARRAERDRLAGIADLAVTMSREILTLA